MASAQPSATSAVEPIVFIVDDDISVRESLETLVHFFGWKVETFSSGQEFLSRPRADCPSCILLDVSLPDLNGLDIQNLVSTDRPDMPIIFITGHGDIPMTVRAMKAGAVEFLTKPIDNERLLDAIETAIGRSKETRKGQAEIEMIRDRWATLTPREREVLVLVADGLLNKQVGYKLGISEITVKAHRGKAMSKMEADSVPSLVRMISKFSTKLDGPANHTITPGTDS